nr:solute carrier organic anion transporter family member 4A1-like [Cherax quadricarinatus]
MGIVSDFRVYDGDDDDGMPKCSSHNKPGGRPAPQSARSVESSPGNQSPYSISYSHPASALSYSTPRVDKQKSAKSRVGSGFNVAVFSSTSSASSGSWFMRRQSRPESEVVVKAAVSPCTTPVRNVSRKLFIISRNSLWPPSPLKPIELSSQYKQSEDQTSQPYEDRMSPTFITLPSSGSVIHPIPHSDWREFRPRPSSTLRISSMSQVLAQSPATLLLNTIIPSAGNTSMPSVDTCSLHGFLNVPSKIKSSTNSEPDVNMGLGVRVGVSSSRADLVLEDGGGGGDEEEEKVGDCGWLCLRPQWLQQTRTAKWVLFWLCWAAAAQGLIAGAYDMASVLCSVPVSYLGSRPGSSKPRWLGWGVFILGLGSFVFTLPHFGSPAYNPSSSDFTSILFCLREGTRETHCGVAVENWLSSFRHIFVLGQFLHGVGATPLYTLGITYLDESVPVKMSSMYLGIFYAMAVLGPALGYLLGGQFLKVYIDAPSVDPTRLGLRANSDLWLGGWWIGFLVSGTISILISWPIMAFPSHLPGAKAIKAERVSEAYATGSSSTPAASGFGRLKDLPGAVRVLACNPTFVALSLAGATEGILLTGFATFMPKFIENQFSIPASYAALIVGFVVVPAGGGGTFLGGWLVKRLQLRCSGILKMCIIFSFICLLSCFTFVISCPNIDFAGVNVDYSNKSVIPSWPNLTSWCNNDCGCQDVAYDPVCGTNNVMYFSPCHAGCTGMQKGQDGLKVRLGEVSRRPRLGQKKLGGIQGYIRRGQAMSKVSRSEKITRDIMRRQSSRAREVKRLPRCVPDSHRSFALGLQWIVVRLLGTIPGPILFGALIDDTCILWQSTCGKGGACRSYDNFYMSRLVVATCACADDEAAIIPLIVMK